MRSFTFTHFTGDRKIFIRKYLFSNDLGSISNEYLSEYCFNVNRRITPFDNNLENSKEDVQNLLFSCVERVLYIPFVCMVSQFNHLKDLITRSSSSKQIRRFKESCKSLFVFTIRLQGIFVP